ncbi:hypothetical protein HG530_006965 [Fusarium avenaceum]|nr:hypothetical protein HG530_006965 [Fusarium avenaceum]
MSISAASPPEEPPGDSSGLPGRLGHDDGAQFLEDGDHDGRVGGGLEGAAHVTESCVDSLDVKLIFDGDGDAVEGTDEAFVSVEEGVEISGTFDGRLEEWFAEAVCLGC